MQTPMGGATLGHPAGSRRSPGSNLTGLGKYVARNGQRVEARKAHWGDEEENEIKKTT